MISQRVAALVMIIVIVVPFLSYPVDDFSTDAWLRNLKTVAKNKDNNALHNAAYLDTMADDFQNFYKHKDVTLASVKVCIYIHIHVCVFLFSPFSH